MIAGRQWFDAAEALFTEMEATKNKLTPTS
jgi:hypothetical protein